ncbi:uroporphyrinogen-III C-methyltransferase [Alkalimonas sp. NCh-2]|uniref:uroporphyrinogen-III C-methyltransferase n=1 Tax=Alkalimonas sp. NCh-2 TaxID=3144846 RepID=UPI0031F6D03D
MMRFNQAFAAGEVALVGAGPGAADLLTLRAVRLMEQAEVVLYDRLVSDEVMALLPAKCRRIDVGKKCGQHSVSQQRIGELLVHYARQGLRVLRLKGGDPAIFARLGEELDALVQAGIAYQLVPGISAASGCAAAAGIPLTERGQAQQLRFISAVDQHSATSQDWADLSAPNQTLVFYMGTAALGEISQQLQQHGLAADWPVLLVQQGCRPQQQIQLTDLQSAAAVAASLSTPCLIIIGQVALRYRQQQARLQLPTALQAKEQAA